MMWMAWITGAGAAEITVSAAASLKEAFTEMGRAFESANPAHKVLFNFAASGQLLQQIAQGAPVDVFASADEETMDKAARQGLVNSASRTSFARNQLVVVVPAVSSPPYARLTELARPEVKRIAIGNPESVPAGRYAKEVLETARLWADLQPKIVNAQNVRQVLDYVARDEVDAGFVYATDAALAVNRVRVVERPATAVTILYPIAVVSGAANAELAAAFVRFVRGESGQRILAGFGFLRP
jgi:molybdate transport system substrate-binding protein